MASFLQGIVMGAAQEGTRSIRASAKAESARKLAKEKSDAQAARELKNIDRRGGFQESVARIGAAGTITAARIRSANLNPNGVFDNTPDGAKLASIFGKNEKLSDEAFMFHYNRILGSDDPADAANKDFLWGNSKASWTAAQKAAGHTRAARTSLGKYDRNTNTFTFDDRIDMPEMMKRIAGARAQKIAEEIESTSPSGNGTKKVVEQTAPDKFSVTPEKTPEQKNKELVESQAIAEANIAIRDMKPETATWLKGSSRTRHEGVSEADRMYAAKRVNTMVQKLRTVGYLTDGEHKSLGGDINTVMGPDGDLADHIRRANNMFTAPRTKRVGGFRIEGGPLDRTTAGTRDKALRDASPMNMIAEEIAFLRSDAQALGDVPGIYGTQFLGGLFDTLLRFKDELVSVLKDTSLGAVLKNATLPMAAEDIASRNAEIHKLYGGLKATEEQKAQVSEILNDLRAKATTSRDLRIRMEARRLLIIFTMVKVIQKGDKVSNTDYEKVEQSLRGGIGAGSYHNQAKALKQVGIRIEKERLNTSMLQAINNDPGNQSNYEEFKRAALIPYQNSEEAYAVWRTEARFNKAREIRGEVVHEPVPLKKEEQKRLKVIESIRAKKKAGGGEK